MISQCVKEQKDISLQQLFATFKKGPIVNFLNMIQYVRTYSDVFFVFNPIHK